MKKRKLSSFLHVKELFIYKGSKEYNDEIMFCFFKVIIKLYGFFEFFNIFYIYV